MFPWTKLPNELRHEVVKRMDFISRFRFRGVSKTDQQLVDTVPLYIPRIVFNSQHENKAHLTFFLGIENRIDVFFVKEKDGKYKVTRSHNFTSEDNSRRVELHAHHHRFCDSALVYAAIVFRNVAMNPETILGGFEFVPNVFNCKTACDMLYFFGKIVDLPNRFFRAKTLMIENGCNMAIVACCSIPDLLELQVLVNCPDHPQLMSYTKKQRYRIYDEEEREDFEKEGTGLKLDNQYILTETEDVRDLAKKPGFWERFVAQFDAVEVAPNRYVTHEVNGPMNHKQSHTSSCGIAIQKSTHKAEKEDPTACDLRWACPKHADPFEHWYYTQKIKSAITLQPPDALLNFTGKRSYFEYVFPVINGKSIVMDGLTKQSVDAVAEKRHANLVTPGARIRKGINGDDGPIPSMEGESEEDSEESVSLEDSEVSDEESELESVGSESLEDSEVSDGSEVDEMESDGSEESDEESYEDSELESVGSESLDDSEVSNGSKVSSKESELELVGSESDLEVSDEEGSLGSDMESKGSEALKVAVGGEVLEALKVLDVLESEGLEVLESKRSEAGGEVQKEVKVSDVLHDSEAEEEADNPFNTEEFKAKFNESTDKSWVNLMIFAVLSVVLSVFVTFFLF